MPNIKMHKSVTSKRVCEILEDSYSSLENPGICIACGEDASGCEPDARNYECECCNAKQVFGVEELLFYVAI